jgi:hypothetical protein
MRITATQIVKNTNLTTAQNIVRRVITVAPLGARGYGVTSGGTTGQVLAKKTNTNYDTEWVNQTGGGGGSTPDATALVKGKLKLAGDLGGTADLPTVPALANKVDKVTGSRLITSAESVLLGNTSGTNTGDNATNTQYSGLATSKQDALGFTPYNATNPSGYQTAIQVQIIADDKVSNTAYDATSWNGVAGIAASKNAVRNQVELLVTTLSAKADAPSYDNSQPTIALINDLGSIINADTTTYPSVVELTHLKGVNTPIQGQIDDKQPLATVLTNTTASFTTTDETKLDKYPSTATNGKMLQGNGTNYVEVDAPSIGVAPQTGQIIVLTTESPMGFKTPANITTSTVFYIEVVGGGGGGGGALNSTSGAKGSAGGGGGYLFKRITGLTPSTTYTCAIGTGGTGGAVGSNGTAGTATTLTIGLITYTANGGGLGQGAGSLAGGVGGTAVNGDLNYQGQNGGDSTTVSATASSPIGGSTHKGVGIGGNSTRSGIAGNNATGNGGGGSGGHSSAGGNGSNGIIFCQYFN